jgi:hypothetical protein
VVDDPHRHEQRRLVQRVRQRVDRGGPERGRGADPDQAREQPQPAHRRVGQQRLQVRRLHRHDRGEQRRAEPDQDERDLPQRLAAEHGREAEHQVDAGLDHRGGVQVGADGGRGDHRSWQPEVERPLGGLGRGGEQQQHDRSRRDPRVTDHLGVGQDRTQRRGAGRNADQEHPGQQRQPAERGRDERAGRPLLALAEAADQEVAGDARQLPEHEQQHDVVGQHQAQHRPGEERQQRQVAAGRRALTREVAGRVGQHQRADPEHDPGEQQPQAVHPQRQVEPDRRQPGAACLQGAAVQHRPGVRAEPQREPGQHGGAEVARVAAAHAHGQRH